MPIRVIVELQAKPGRRDELRSLTEGIVAAQGPSMPRQPVNSLHQERASR